MNPLVLTTVFVGNLIVTSYRALPNQTDSTPFNTSTGEHVRPGGCAISRDLLCAACRRLHHRCKEPGDKTKLHYGDWLYSREYGFRQINDVMSDFTTVRIKGKRVRLPITMHVDLFVGKWAEEHAVGVQHLEIYKVEERQ